MEAAQQPQSGAATNDAVVHGEPLEWRLLRTSGHSPVGRRTFELVGCRTSASLNSSLKPDRQQTAPLSPVAFISKNENGHDLIIVDTHSRYCPAADPRFTCRGEDVVHTLEQVRETIGQHTMWRVPVATISLQRPQRQSE